MAASGVGVDEECMKVFNELKLGKNLKWITFKINDDWKKIVVDETSTDPDYDVFREKLLGAKSTWNKKEGLGGRYAVYDFEYSIKDEGTRNKIGFITYVPDEAPQRVRMLYSTSKIGLKNALSGIHADIAAHGSDDLEYDDIVKGLGQR